MDQINIIELVSHAALSIDPIVLYTRSTLASYIKPFNLIPSYTCWMAKSDLIPCFRKRILGLGWVGLVQTVENEVDDVERTSGSSTQLAS